MTAAIDMIDPELAARGHRWEEPIADMILSAKGLYVVGEQSCVEHQHDRRRRWTADGFLATAPEVPITDVVAGLEIKTRNPYAPWPWDYWEAQCQTAMDVSGLDRCLLAIATIDQELGPDLQLTEELVDLKLRWIHADPLLQADLAATAEWLLEHIDAGVLPEPTDAGALPYLEAAHRIADPEATADIDDLAELLERYDSLTAAEKAATAERKLARARVIARMKSATEATTTDGEWRVRLGAPVRRLTRAAEGEFIATYCMHSDDCEPDCDRHRPDLLDARVNVDVALEEGYGDELDALKHPTTERRLTVKRLAPENTETP